MVSKRRTPIPSSNPHLSRARPLPDDPPPSPPLTRSARKKRDLAAAPPQTNSSQAAVARSLDAQLSQEASHAPASDANPDGPSTRAEDAQASPMRQDRQRQDVAVEGEDVANGSESDGPEEESLAVAAVAAQKQLREEKDVRNAVRADRRARRRARAEKIVQAVRERKRRDGEEGGEGVDGDGGEGGDVDGDGMEVEGGKGEEGCEGDEKLESEATQLLPQEVLEAASSAVMKKRKSEKMRKREEKLRKQKGVHTKRKQVKEVSGGVQVAIVGSRRVTATARAGRLSAVKFLRKSLKKAGGLRVPAAEAARIASKRKAIKR